jgi:multidrug transporter EmrE-like cation transporter
MNYLYILGTIIFTVYGQIILKYRIGLYGEFPKDFFQQIKFLTYLFFDIWILSGFIAAIIASFFWMAAMTKFEITVAYPFMSLAPALVFILGIWLLGENFSLGKVIGLVLIILGTFVTVKF